MVSADSLNLVNRKLMDAVNATGEIFLTHTQIGDRFVLRFVVSHIRTTESHVLHGWELLQKQLAKIRGG